MQMDWAGIAAGASEGLEQLLAQQIREREMRRQAALDAERARQFDTSQQQTRDLAGLEAEQQRVRLAQDASQFAARSAQGERGLDLEAQRIAEQQRQFDADANLRGVKLMNEEFAARNAITPEREQEMSLERIRANAAATGGMRAPRYVTRTWTDPATGQAMSQTMTEDEAAAMGPVPAVRPTRATTGQERTTLGFAQRMEAALRDLEPIEDEIANQGLAGQLQGQFAPNVLQTETQQLYRQAQRAFTEARLRKESGAAIPEAEFINDARTYFAQPGDAPAVVAQKRARRAEMVQSFFAQAPNAYREYTGQDTPNATPPTAASSAGEEWVRGPNGKLMRK